MRPESDETDCSWPDVMLYLIDDITVSFDELKLKEVSSHGHI